MELCLICQLYQHVSLLSVKGHVPSRLYDSFIPLVETLSQVDLQALLSKVLCRLIIDMVLQYSFIRKLEIAHPPYVMGELLNTSELELFEKPNFSSTTSKGIGKCPRSGEVRPRLKFLHPIHVHRESRSQIVIAVSMSDTMSRRCTTSGRPRGKEIPVVFRSISDLGPSIHTANLIIQRIYETLTRYAINAGDET
jgi:hypothetical protein